MGLEKMALPPKPYEKGKDWTPDSANCEGCHTAFTWVNRKHHCRRCGGLFCNDCTLDRVYLRGQGDAPARVCKACKQISDAAKFESRYGKSKTSRGSSRASISKEDGTDTFLKQLLEKPQDDEVDVESIVAGVADHDRDNFHELLSPSQEKAPVSPTKLLEQAQEEKKRYSALKKQGKDAEALKVFKRAKELERQAEALEKEIKHQRRVSASSSSVIARIISPSKEDPQSSPDANSKQKSPSENLKKRRALSQDQGKEKASANETDDFLHELKTLGWSDKEIREADRKPAAKTEEQLLSELAAEVRAKPDRAAPSAAAPGPNGVMSTQIMAHKRQALALKREGRLAEAKDELRKAKILEKQAEEIALLGQGEGDDEASDDDELQALIRGLEREEKSKGNAGKRGASSQPVSEDYSIFTNFVGDDDDADVEVDDHDLDDPDMAAALKAMGFEDEEAPAISARASKPQPRATITTEATTEPNLKQQILARKRKALVLKREGKTAEARAELAEAKKLEQLQNSSPPAALQAPVRKVPEPSFDGNTEENEENVEVTDQDMRDPQMMATLRAMGFGDDEPTPSVSKPEPVDEASLKQRILGFKRQAVALKREGRLDEAREVLRQAKVLEQQLEDPQAASVLQRQEETPAIIKQSREVRRGVQALPALSGLTNSDDEGGEEDVEVDNADLIDPDIAAALAAVGWQEDPAALLVTDPKKDDVATVVSDVMPANLRPAGELQPPEEAETQKVDVMQVTMKELEPASGASSKSSPSPATSNTVLSNKTKSELQRELLGRKRRALALKREGKSEEARIELQEAKIIEQQLAELEKSLAAVIPPIVFAESKTAAAAVQTAHPPQQASKHLLKQESEPSRPIYLDDEPVDVVDVTENDMQDPAMLAALAGLGFLEDKDGTVSSKATSVTGKKEPAGGITNSPDLQAQPGKGGEKMEALLDFDWGIPQVHAKKTGNDSGTTKKVNKKVQVVDSSMEDNPFDGEYGEIGQTLDLVPPRLGQKDSAPPAQRRNPWRFMDILSGEISSSDLSMEQTEGIQSKTLPSLPQVSSKPPERPAPIAEPKTDAMASAQPATLSLQQEMSALKRKALALKREGKTGEAREELRKAKLLERQITAQQESPAVVLMSTVTAAAAGTSSASTHGKVKEISSVTYTTTPSRPEPPPAVVKTSPPSKSPGHKEEMQKQVRQTKDRMKLQQESLAHKRKAMGLRRQGKADEADAEYELAKELEKQMEDLDPMHGKGDLGDVAGVDDLLDPQLLAALKGVGFKEGDLKGSANVPASTGVTEQPQRSNVGSSSSSSYSKPAGTGALDAEKKQLEKQIRAQKLQAVQLKRAGKQGEALEKLRGAKQLEKRLLAMAS